jgi:hypothetical protein
LPLVAARGDPRFFIYPSSQAMARFYLQMFRDFAISKYVRRNQIENFHTLLFIIIIFNYSSFNFNCKQKTIFYHNNVFYQTTATLGGGVWGSAQLPHCAAPPYNKTMSSVKIALANFIINRKMKNGKGFAGPEIAEIYLLKKDGKKIRIAKDHIMTPLHLLMNYDRRELSCIVAKEYLKGQKYRKHLPINDDVTPIFPLRYKSSFEESLQQITCNNHDVTKAFTRFLGPEMAGVNGSNACVTDVFYRKGLLKKHIVIGDELIFTFINELTCITRNYVYTVTANVCITDMLANAAL